MRLIVTIFFLVFFNIAAFSQTYRVTPMLTPSAFQPLSEAEPTLAMNWGAEDPYSYIEVPGDTMSFFGVKYPLDKIGVSYYGNLKFENENSAVILDAFFTFLDSTNPAAKVKYRITEESGSSSIVIDYQNIGMPNCASDVLVNFQIVLSEKDGVFAINYGPSNIVCDSAFGGGSGPYVGIFRSSLDFSTFYKIAWLSGDPASPKVVAASLPALKGSPISGQSYLFTPPSADVQPTDITQNELRAVSDGERMKIVFTPMPGEQSLTICDMLGKTVASIVVATNQDEVILPQLPKGAYIARMGAEHVLIVR